MKKQRQRYTESKVEKIETETHREQSEKAETETHTEQCKKKKNRDGDTQRAK